MVNGKWGSGAIKLFYENNGKHLKTLLRLLITV